MGSDVLGWAAMAAAVISLANLFVTTYVTGRRSQTSWARDALTDVVTTFLDASWHHTDEVRRRGTDAEVPSGSSGELDDLRHQLTRLRILGSPELCRAAVELVRLHGRLGMAPVDVEAALRAVSASRYALVATAKRDLRLR